MADFDALLARLKSEAAQYGPLMLREMLAVFGTKAEPGSGDNPVIMGWARDLGLGDDYDHDRIPWCGLTMAHVASRAGKPLPKDPLWALNWKSFGVPVARPMLGDVMVKTRDGGGHVTLYVAETSDHYLCIGGNQGHCVCVSAIPKVSGQFKWAFRRPKYINQPISVRPLYVTGSGAVQMSES